jgi:methionyl-tRNA formyltransferase
LLSPGRATTSTTTAAGHRRIVSRLNHHHRVVFLGTPEVAAETLVTLYNASQKEDSIFFMEEIITQPPKPGKRNQPTPSPVQKIALKKLHKLDVWTPDKINAGEILDHLEFIKPDLCVTAAYGQYLPKRFLAIPKFGTVNIHPSLLPKYRGASPVQRCLQNGDRTLGVSILYTVSKMDAGPVIAQKAIEVDENEGADVVLSNLFRIGTELLLEHLPAIFSGEMTMETATPQDEAAATHAPLIKSEEGQVRVWEESAKTIHDRLRAFKMWPQVSMWFKVGQKRPPIQVKLLETRVVPDTKVDPTDEVKLGPTKESGLYVVCGDGSVLEVLQLKPATKKAFSARDFQNGFPNETIRWVRPPTEEKS